MGRKLQIKRGVKSALPPLEPGELAMTTDEKTLYYGTGTENIPVARTVHGHQITDVANLETSLSNKADKNGGTILNLDTAKVSGSYTWMDVNGVFDCGKNSLFSMDVVAPNYTQYEMPSVVQTLTCTYGSTHIGTTYRRTFYYATGWTTWQRLATATPPQEYALPLAAGLTDAGSEYRKNQFNEVTVGLAVSGAIAAGAVVATLPAGYRPKAGKQMAVTAVSAAGTAVAGFCLIESATGHIINQCGAVAKLVGEWAFVAVD